MPRTAKPTTDQHLRIIQAMAAKGLTLDDIAPALDISPATLDRWLQREDVRQAYEKGRSVAKAEMATRLWEIAMSNDEKGLPTKQATTAVIFWLKAQAKWTERLVVEAPTDLPQVMVYIPDNDRD
jgi:transposase-like protein